MRLYLDDDSASSQLAQLLRREGHDVQVPLDVGLGGEDDAVHLTRAVADCRVCLSGNERDFRILHNLVMQVGGHHPGILIVCRENNPRRDLTPRGIVNAIKNLVAANIPLVDQFVIVNHWR
jgi:hypothetical protein